MSQPVTPPAPLVAGTTMAHLRRRKREATQALLGDTIAISDRDWQQPSLLPGWTRAHVATHLARNADALRRVAHGLLTHAPGPMYPDAAAAEAALEEGSLRGALDLQIDLDTSAGRLNDTLNYLEEAATTERVQLSPGRWVGAHELPLARLQEVVLHHVDLDCGFTTTDIEPDIARWLLEWTSSELAGRADVPAATVTSTSGWEATVGCGEPTRRAHGSDAQLLGWLTGRTDGSSVLGADGLTFPLL